jgi:hypothetical protein
MNRSRRALTAAAAPAALLALLAAPAAAVVTSTWTVETYQQFDQGDATAAFITSLGEVKPGWDTGRVALEGNGVWSALRLADGSILAGTDQGGALFRITGERAEKLLALDGAIAVVALAQGADGTVYAGALPGDAVWRIDVGARKAHRLATLSGVETVWSLAVSGGAVYAGTGPAGKLFRIDKGKAREVFATDDKRITALATGGDGAVWLGTSDRALVFRHDPRSGQTRAMADFAGNEVTAIAAVGGGVVVAANELTEVPAAGAKTATQVADAEKPGKPKGEAAKMPDVGSKPGADKDTPANAAIPRKGERKGKGALFRVGDDGRLEQLHALTTTYFTSIAVDPEGQIYAGAADKGRIYLVAKDDSVATAFDVDERSVSHVFWDGKAGQTLAFTTDDGAALYRSKSKASQARYVSEVFDAKTPSKFGKLTWLAGGKLTVETRSGNTAKPGPGWSAWATPSQVGKLGGGVAGGRIASPPGRYLQFRVAFQEGQASLRRVTAFYVPQNRATRIEEVTIEPASKESTPTLKDAAGRPRNPVIKVKWKIDNPDGDETFYTIHVRRDGEAHWRPLVTDKQRLSATSWDWNSEAFPDGWYRIRVVSSDAAANSPDRALTSTQTSALFAVDNTRPVIDGLQVTYPRATAKATDAISTITEMAFSIDDGPWQLGTTADGIFDDLSETLVIHMPRDLGKGTHTLAIRVADAAGNVASTSTTFVVK